LKKKLLYGILFLFFNGIFFSLKLNAQDQPALDTIIITPESNYETNADSATAVIDEKIEPGDETVTYNDSLISRFRPIPSDTIQMMNGDSRFYYKNYFDSLLRASQIPKKVKPVDNSFLKLLFELIIWIGAIGIFAFLVYKLFLSNSSLFARNRRNVNGEKIKVDDENPEDPASLVDMAVSEGNYRLAVRYLYLQTLINLAEKKYLRTGTEKTNYQYVNEIRNQPFANDFASLTLKYEYVWYGEYPLDNEVYEQIQTGFKNFNKHIGR